MGGLSNKVEQTDIFLNEVKPDIFLIAEHGLEHSNIEAIHFTNYNLMSHYSRSNLQKGGVAIYMNKKINFDNFKILNCGLNLNEEQIFESTDICLEIGGNKINISSLYRSPIEQNLNIFF